MRLLLGFRGSVAGLHVKCARAIVSRASTSSERPPQAESPMQVATLFRESSTLLGASMETGGCPPDSGVAGLVPGPGQLSYDSYNHPVTFSNKYKLWVPPELNARHSCKHVFNCLLNTPYELSSEDYEQWANGHLLFYVKYFRLLFMGLQVICTLYSSISYFRRLW